MRIHTNTLTRSDIYTAADSARAQVYISDHGSRSRDHAFHVSLTGESWRPTNTGYFGAGREFAATWDQWGVFLAALFILDPSITIPKTYESAEDFHAKTFDRFIGGWPADAHGDHSWKDGQCRRCSARR